MDDEKTAGEVLLDNGYDDVKILSDYGYDTALIGVTEDNRAVYDYEKMKQWLIIHEEMNEDEALDWLEYNTIRALPYFGEDGPVVVHLLEVVSDG